MLLEDAPVWLALLAAAAGVMVGHFFRVLRWALLSQPFVTARTSHYFLALSLGYVANFIFPFRLGELLRTLVFARIERARFSHVLASVIIDRWLDLLCVGAIALCLPFLGMLEFGSALKQIGPTLVIALLIGIGLLLAAVHHPWFRRCAALAASPFNDRLRRNILALAWAIAQLTDYLRRSVSVRLLALYTLLMWVAYGVSLVGLARLISHWGPKLTSAEAFEAVYFYPLTWAGIQRMLQLNLSTESTLIFAGYLLLPLAVVIGYLSFSRLMLDSLLSRRIRTLNVLLQIDDGRRHLNIYLDPRDELAFLEAYTSGGDHRALLVAFEVNQDVQVLQDLSGSSRAHTMLAQKDGRIFYRKYALGDEAVRLQEQFAWLEKFQNQLPLAEICGHRIDRGYMSYDMTYWPGCTPLFDALHSLPVEKGGQLLDTLLDRLQDRLHQPFPHMLSSAAIGHYLDQKLWGNLATLEHGGVLGRLLTEPELIVNSEPIPGWPRQRTALEGMNLPGRFNPQGCVVHGDLTIENIVYAPQHGFQAYIIDPNPIQLISSKWLEYGKVAQSLHAGYEFLRNTHWVNVSGAEITFNLPRSEQYARLWEHIRARIHRHGGDSAVQEVLLHEIIHFARLLPYRVEKEPATAPAYLATFLRLVNSYVVGHG